MNEERYLTEDEKRAMDLMEKLIEDSYDEPKKQKEQRKHRKPRNQNTTEKD